MDRSLIVLLLATTLSSAIVAESPAAEKDVAFPPNEAGKHAAAYFQAYGKGEEAMKRFFERHASAAALKRRPVSQRLGIYRDMREEHGALKPVEIPEFTESSVKVVARAERGGRVAITVLCEEKPPHAFIAVRVEDLPPEEGTPEGSDDGGYSTAPRMSDEEVAAAPAALAGTASTQIQMAASPERVEAHGPPPTPDGTSIPAGGVDVLMEWAGHMATVSVMLNGEGPFRFAIDTGAQGTARIDAEVARRLKLPVVGSVQVGDPSGKNDQSATLVRIKSLGIGGARFTGLTASIGDFADGKRGAPVDGVLGFGLFADCLLTLNFPDLRLGLRAGALPEVNGTDVLSFGSEDGIPSVTLRVGGVDVRAHVDVGAMGGISLPETLAETLPLGSEPRVVGRARTVSNEFEIKAAELNGEVALGSLTWSHPMVEFQPIFPVANVGARILRELTLTFDQRNHRLRLSRA